MTGDEFKPILAYAATACSAPSPTQEQTKIYFDLLKDLRADIVQAAVKQAVIDHVYPNLPPVGVIRKAAMGLMHPTIPAAKAWELFREAVAKHGSGRTTLWANGQRIPVDRMQNGLDSLPPIVARAARAFGWQTLCDTPPDKMGVAQNQFIKNYEAMTDHDQSSAIAPPEVQALIAQLAAKLGTGDLVMKAIGQ